MNVRCTIPESAPPLAGDPTRPVNGLMSLWDMLDTFGLKFARASIFLCEAKWFWGLLDQQVRLGDPTTSFQQISRPGVEAATKAALDLFREACELARIDRIKPDLQRLQDMIWRPHPAMPATGSPAIAAGITNLLSRAQDELAARHFFGLKEEYVKFYGQKDAFGAAVGKKFKAASSDIEQAGNCLALEQPTACIFHLMRAMEVAVRQLARRLNITITPQTTWRQMTGAMDHKIRAMPETSDRQKHSKNDWEAARANLHHVGSVWRNNTMHPATSYTQSQALDVMNAVRVFMSGLAAL